MGTKSLFTIALGLGKPWIITKVDLGSYALQLDIHIDFEEVSTNEIFNVVLNRGRNKSKYR